MMPASTDVAKTRSSVSSAAADEFHRLRAYVETPAVFERVWSKHFSAQERDELTPSADNIGTVAAWRQVRGGTIYRAVLDIARSVDLIADGDYTWLLREIGEEPAPRRQPDCSNDSATIPHWDRSTGDFWFRGKRCAWFRIMKVVSKVQIILDAFEGAGWPKSIANPIPNCEPNDLYPVISRINCRLKKVCFHAQRGGKEIGWSKAQVNSN